LLSRILLAAQLPHRSGVVLVVNALATEVEGIDFPAASCRVSDRKGRE
jgi:hypothetical protein